MGHVNTISGFIHEASYSRASEDMIRAHNDGAIERLPREDAWPPLTRDVFFLPPPAPFPPPYRGRVLAIAWSSNQVLECFEAWRAKLESLLRDMIWDHALVTVTTEWWGDYLVRWDAISPEAPEGLSTTAAWRTSAWRLDTCERLDPPVIGFDG